MNDFIDRAEVIEWRGPSPFYFALLSPTASAKVAEVAPALSYGWGAIRADVTVGSVEWETAIFPKDGRYVVPLKQAVRKRLAAESGLDAQTPGTRLDVRVVLGSARQ